MQVVGRGAPQAFGKGFVEQAVGGEGGQQFVEAEPAILKFWHCGHGGFLGDFKQ
ncbi:hypothetical protein GCM10009091_16190 [Pseudomonas brenneri]|nr:hypothetical protein GCM10009091_16190 [Pseudomonas brenneri]